MEEAEEHQVTELSSNSVFDVRAKSSNDNSDILPQEHSSQSGDNKSEQTSQLSKVFIENHFLCPEAALERNNCRTHDDVVVMSPVQNGAECGLNIIVGQSEQQQLGYMVLVDPEKIARGSNNYTYSTEQATNPNTSERAVRSENALEELPAHRNDSYTINGSHVMINNINTIHGEVALTLASLTEGTMVQKVLCDVSGDQSCIEVSADSEATMSSLPPFSNIKSSQTSVTCSFTEQEGKESCVSNEVKSNGVVDQWQQTEEVQGYKMLGFGTKYTKLHEMSNLSADKSQAVNGKRNFVPTGGRRLFELSCLIEALEPLLACECGMSKLQLREDVTEAKFLYSALYLVCEACGFFLYLPTSSCRGKDGDLIQWEVNCCTDVLKNEHQIEENLLQTVFSVYDIPYVETQSDSSDRHYIDEDSNTEASQTVEEQNQAPHEYFELSSVNVQDDKVSFNKNIQAKSKKSSTNSKPRAKVSKPKKVHLCTICMQKFSSRRCLVHHMRKHVGSLFPCTKCEETFIHRNLLEAHMVVHKNNLQCKVCGKNFGKSCNLTQHMRVHTGEKPFPCSICGKSFTDASTLKKHTMGIHSTDRPLHCDVCGKSFYHNGHLREHIRRHTGERPYACSICGKTYSYHDSVKKHMVVHTGHQKFQCNVCNRTFKWRESLKQHAKTHVKHSHHSLVSGQRTDGSTGQLNSENVEKERETVFEQASMAGEAKQVLIGSQEVTVAAPKSEYETITVQYYM